jgi:hypothetical protein
MKHKESLQINEEVLFGNQGKSEIDMSKVHCSIVHQKSFAYRNGGMSAHVHHAWIHNCIAPFAVLKLP